MTQISKPISQELNVSQGRALKDDELDAVSGGYWAMTVAKAASVAQAASQQSSI